MPNHLNSQTSALVFGVNAFAPFVQQLHAEFDSGAFADWPTVILTQTMQATVVSLYKLLPPPERTDELVDRRSLATLVRNVVDSHDVMSMLIQCPTADEHHLNRQILGYYIAGRFAHIQATIDRAAAQKFYPLAKEKYWEQIQNSPLFERTRMARLKSGETIFYRTRSERVRAACGKNSDFVAGVLADLSTYVHSIPPAVWMGSSSDPYADTEHGRDVLAIWIRIANFFYARSVAMVMKAVDYKCSDKLDEFLGLHREVFSK